MHLREVLRALRGAGLMANPKKWAIGRVEVRYLGLGHGQVHPQIDKTAAIVTCPIPKTKKEVRQFLGLAGYMGQVQNEEHLCLIAVVGVERPDNNPPEDVEKQRETEWRLKSVHRAKAIAGTNTESEI